MISRPAMANGIALVHNRAGLAHVIAWQPCLQC